MSSNSERVLQIACMLVASKSEDGSFDADPVYFRRLTHLNEEPNFKPLIQSDFLEVVGGASVDLADASVSISSSGSNSSPVFKEKTSGRACGLPAGLLLSTRMKEFAEKRGVSDPADEFDSFVDYHKSHGSTMKDWEAAWRTWVRNYQRFGGRKRNGTIENKHADRQKRALEERERALSGSGGLDDPHFGLLATGSKPH